MPPSITAKYIKETLASLEITPWFLFEFHSHRFESLDLPPLPADRSDFDVHGALLDDKVQINCNALHFALS